MNALNLARMSFCFLLGVCAGCKREPNTSENIAAMNYTQSHADMLRQLKDYGIKQSSVLKAMKKVPRHLFIPEAYRKKVNPYGDYPCAIGYGQTISQPYIVAYMTEKLNLRTKEKVLEIGTGSGYQAAVLAACGARVYTIEIIPELARHARAALDEAGYQSVKTKTGDGHQGWEEHAPYDAVIVTCAPEKIPPRLIEQLREGGRMILPLGEYAQRLIILHKQNGEVKLTEDIAVRFVPMIKD